MRLKEKTECLLQPHRIPHRNAADAEETQEKSREEKTVTELRVIQKKGERAGKSILFKWISRVIAPHGGGGGGGQKKKRGRDGKRRMKHHRQRKNRE